ncbi:MAG TPA: hypothetical protein VGN76_01545 [Gemmatimonadales bacterium]|nr:hypothetical protein [Gemmatimonadales bacterium]
MRLDLACFVTGLAGTALILGGCGPSTSTVLLAGGPAPVRLGVYPAVARSGEALQVSVASPNADSIELRSANGMDRYSSAGPALQVSLPSNFGDSASETRFAVRSHGRLLNVLKKPLNVSVCRNRICQSYYHELSVLLPERNRRRIAVTGSWGTAFTTRAAGGTDLPVSRRARSRSEWNLQAELAAGAVSARLQGYSGPDGLGASLDASRQLKRGDGLSYGLAVHLEGVEAQWHPAGISPSGGGMGYRASIGPAIMLKGITASTQLGIYADGGAILQELSTFISINGGLTEVRVPVTVTLDKTFSFGDQSMMPRRQEQLERLTIAWEFLPSVALRLRVASRRSTWPTGQLASDLYASEAGYTLGAQYTLGW